MDHMVQPKLKNLDQPAPLVIECGSDYEITSRLEPSRTNYTNNSGDTKYTPFQFMAIQKKPPFPKKIKKEAEPKDMK